MPYAWSALFILHSPDEETVFRPKLKKVIDFCIDFFSGLIFTNIEIRKISLEICRTDMPYPSSALFILHSPDEETVFSD